MKVTSRIIHFFSSIRRNTQVLIRYKNWSEILSTIRKKENVTEIILRNGIRFYAPKNHSNLLAMVNETFFEKIHTLKDIGIKDNDEILDIGANVGVVTVFMAQRTKGTVHAVEASPENCEYLKKNITANNIQNVRLYNLAVCDKTQEKIRLYLDQSFGNSLSTEDCPADKFVDVPAMSFSDLIDDTSAQEIGFMKMDCEGAEGMIFSSTPIEYLTKVREMDVEFHDTCSSLKHGEIQALLEKGGFQVELHWPFGENSPYGALHAKRI